MSTKTSIKRIAAVAAVALTLGGFSAVSAHAAASAVTAAITSGSGDNGVAGIAGPANVLSVDVTPKNDGTNQFGAYVSVSGAGSTIASATSGLLTVNASGTLATIAGVSSQGTSVAVPVRITTPQVGTITVSVYNASTFNGTTYSSTADKVLTITVNAAGTSNIYSSSTVYGASETTTAAAITSTTDAAFSVSADKDVVSTAVAAFTVTEKDAAGTALTTGATMKAISVYTTIGTWTVTGGSDTSSVVGTTTNYATLLPTDGQNGTTVFHLNANKQAGNAQVTISVNGVAVKSYVVTFYSTTVASATITTPYSYVASSATLAKGPTAPKAYNFVVKALDASGNTIKTVNTNTFSSSDTTIVATNNITASTYDSTLGGYPVVVTGSAAGDAVITVKNAAGTVLGTTTIHVVDSVAASVKLSLDAASYAPGDVVTATLTAANAAGLPIADGAYTTAVSAGFLTTALAANTYYQNGATPFATVVFVGGKATDTFYAPTASFNVSATTGTSASLASAVQGLALSASATVANAAADAAQAAVDAANEATDAANAATDAANNAMDSADAAQQAALDAGDKADAALAAVTDLATKVSAIASQIASLSALVKKIAAKVKA